MMLTLHKPQSIHNTVIQLPGSKSISNRILLIKAISGLDFNINNGSSSDDTQYLVNALNLIKTSTSGVIDVGHAGTDLRFLTAFLASHEGSYELTGSSRLRERPIAELVTALNELGADIRYKEKQGYPPLLINGHKLQGGSITIRSDVSSQFITALLLIAPYFEKGLQITLEGKPVSEPYINMTIELMKRFGIVIKRETERITVNPGRYQYHENIFFVESDWSAASYFYSLIALSPVATKLTLKGLNEPSLQADSVCSSIYKAFGVDTFFQENGIVISKTQLPVQQVFKYNFLSCPDIAQTVAVTCIGLNVSFEFNGLKTLKIKETDRIEAMKTEAAKCGVQLTTSEEEMSFISLTGKLLQPAHIDTYNDHRMAMSFSALCLCLNELTINNHDVVSKSYPGFWDDLKQTGFTQTIIQ